MSKPYAIVLGAAVWAGGQPSPTLRRRAEAAAALYRSGRLRGIVATGGVGDHPPSEAEAIRAVLTAQGVPDDAVILEPRSRNTGENIAFAAALIPGEREVIVVSDAWHLPRALLIARRLGLRATGAAPPLRGARPLFTARAVLRETIALAAWALHLRR